MDITNEILTDFINGRIDSLYAESYASLLAFASRLLADDYALMAEDCVQDAIVKAYHTRHTFATPSQLKAFLYTCVHNGAVSILRKAQSQANYMAQQDTVDDELSASIVEQETLDLLHAAISSLPDKYRIVFEYSYEQGMTNAEAAQLLGITLDGYAKRRARMIALLRNKLRGNPQLCLLVSVLLA